MKFDLLIRNGHAVDPSTGLNARRDVAVARGRIAAVAEVIPSEAAAEIYEADGRIVTPGLIDLHTHIYRGATFWGVNCDAISGRTGVTTWVDAGSAGAFTLDGFREFIASPSPLNIYAFLNISCIGLVAHDYELTNLALCDPNLFELVVNANRDLVMGGKVRLGAATVGVNGFEPLRLARQALDRCGLPLMLHIGERPPDPEDFEHLLRRGDVVTHCFTNRSMRLVDDAGQLRDFARKWIDRGVLLDLGHGISSFAYETAEALLRIGVKPHFISSDLHQYSINGPAYDLPTCLSKLMCLGMTLPEVIACATLNPAKFLGLDREIGSLRVGARADIAVFEAVESRKPLYDAEWNQMPAKVLLRNAATFVRGRLLKRHLDSERPRHLDWRRAGVDDALVAKQDEVRRAEEPSYD